MMYRPNAALRPRSFVTMAQSAVLSFLHTMGIYDIAHRENRARTRVATKRHKEANYRANGLNGPHAMARRARQWDRIEAKRVLQVELAA